MQIGIQLAQLGRLADPAAVRASALAAEALGYSSVWVLDGLLTPRQSVDRPDSAPTGVLDPIATLTYVAACTDRIRLGTSVLMTPWYPPALLARSLASVDVLSDGRLTIGLGATNGVHLDAALAVLDAVWGPAQPTLQPRQRPRPPIILSGLDEDAVVRVARRLLDGWNPADLPVDVLRARWAEVREHADRCGRDPGSLRLVVRATVDLRDRPSGGDRAAFHGSLAQVAGDLDAVRGVGADEVILGCVGDPGLDEALDTYAELAESVLLAATSGRVH